MELMPLLNRLIDFEAVIKAELLAAVPVVVGLIWKRIKSALGPERLDTLTSIARVAVFAAEELSHKGAKVDEAVSGQEKLAYAVNRLVDLAAAAKVKVTVQEAKALIEAVLNEVRPYTEPPESVPPVPASVGAEPRPVVSAFEPSH